MLTRRAIIGGATSLLAMPAIARRKHLPQIGGGGAGGGGDLPAPPDGFAYLVNASGEYLVNADGDYILAKV